MSRRSVLLVPSRCAALLCVVSSCVAARYGLARTGYAAGLGEVMSRRSVWQRLCVATSGRSEQLGQVESRRSCRSVMCRHAALSRYMPSCRFVPPSSVKLCRSVELLFRLAAEFSLVMPLRCALSGPVSPLGMVRRSYAALCRCAENRCTLIWISLPAWPWGAWEAGACRVLEASHASVGRTATGILPP